VQISAFTGKQAGQSGGKGNYEGSAVEGNDVLFAQSKGNGTGSVVHWHVHGSFTRTIDVGKGPTGVVISNGFGWVANHVDDTLSKIDLGSDTVVDTINGVPSANGQAFDDDITAGFGAIWVTASGQDRLMRVDPNSGAVSGNHPTGKKPVSVAAGRDRLWVANRADGTVTPVKP
jgi:streptogramin lyase